MLFESQIHDLVAMLPWVAVSRTKQSMRNIDAQRCRVLVPEQIKEESAKIVAQISELHHFKKAKTVMIFFPVHHEVDLRSLVTKFAGEKTFLYPAVTHRSHSMEVRPYEPHTPFTKGRFGIPQPHTPAYNGPIDLIIVPGMCFDKRHWRVGRGGGYYDRFLRKYKGVYTIGVGYDFQLHEKVPHWWLDRRVDRVITPSHSI